MADVAPDVELVSSPPEMSEPNPYEPNPYAPPVAEAPAPPPVVQAPVAAPTYPLYSPNFIGLAAFLGSPLAGCILMFLNYRRQGRSSEAWMALVGGGVGTAFVMALAFVLPDAVGRLMPFALIIGIRAIAGREQASYDAHLRAGGPKGSGWAAAGVGVASLVAILAVLLPLAIMTGMGTGPKVDFGSSQHITYEEGATKEEANQLGKFLVEIGFFNGKGGKDVKLTHGAGGLVVSFVVGDGVWDDSKMVSAFGTIRHEISTKVYGGRPVTVELCDTMLEVKKTISP